MINNTSLKQWNRITSKSIDVQFMNAMQQGLNCSPFETEIMVEKVHEIYGPLFDHPLTVKPGQIQTMVIDITVPAGVSLINAKQKLVTVTLSDLLIDSEVRKNEGVPSLRQKRLCRICEEAFQQGGLFTLEDISLLFNCGVRTLVIDLDVLKKNNITPPLRSNVKDIGRAITHRAQIISLWLEGKEYSDIAYRTYHTVQSVSNYIEKYKRFTALFLNSFDIQTISFLTRISLPLAKEFEKINSTANPVSHRKNELDEFLKKSNSLPMKKNERKIQ